MTNDSQESLLTKQSIDEEEAVEDSIRFDPDIASLHHRHGRKKGHVLSFWVVRWSGHMLVALLILAVFLDVATRGRAEQRQQKDQKDHHHHHDSDESPASTGSAAVSCDCGQSVAEARRLGCQYDTLAASWLPDACRDDELAREFDRAGPGPGGAWVYYADSTATHELTVEQLAVLPDRGSDGSDGANCFWVSQRWHLLHCTFYWKKLFRQAATGVVMERHYDSMGHIEHCEGLLVPYDGGSGGKVEGLDDIVTEAAVGLSGDRLELGPSGGCPSDRTRAKAKMAVKIAASQEVGP